MEATVSVKPVLVSDYPWYIPC